MTNPYEAPQVQTTATKTTFVFFKRPRSAGSFASIFVAIFIGGLFIPTVELFQLNYSLGHVPLWYAYVGILAPEYWIIAIPIVAAHIVGTVVLTSLVDRFLTSRSTIKQPVEASTRN
jgi:hypothetical protein